MHIIKDVDILKQISVNALPEEVDDIVDKLESSLEECNKLGYRGIGLSAIQIGIPKRVAIVRIGNYKINLVNCVINKTFKPIITDEGCLSFPGITKKINRFDQIIITDNEFGSLNNFCAYGIVAVCCLHEMDHWDGKTIKDI